MTAAASTTWGCFMASVLLLLYHEKVFFDDYFKTGTDYGLVLGLTLVGFLLMIIVGMKLPAKVLVGLLLGVFLTIAVLWVLLGAALPMEPSDLGCIAPICQMPGQLALITLELGIAPPLLLEYFRRSRQALAQAKGFGAEMWAGLGLLAAGLISLAGYYWTYLAFVSLSILTAIGVLAMSSRNLPAPMKAEEVAKGAGLYVGHFLRDLAMLAFVGIFGFSILERDAYSYELLIPFGIGFLAFAIVVQYGARFRGEVLATVLLEGVVVGVITLIIGFAIYVPITNETAVIPVGLPPWIVGFAAAYLWHRMDLLAGGTSMRLREGERHYLKVPLHLIRKVVFSLFLAGLFLLVVLNIDPDGTDSVLILDIACVIGVVYFLFWILHFQRKSSETCPTVPMDEQKAG